jgi:hypothetical protein
MVPVYARGDRDTVDGEQPVMWVTRAQKLRWLDDGWVRSVARGKALRLVLTRMPGAQPSQKMGEAIMVGCVLGRPYAMSCRDGWQGHAAMLAQVTASSKTAV